MDLFAQTYPSGVLFLLFSKYGGDFDISPCSDIFPDYLMIFRFQPPKGCNPLSPEKTHLLFIFQALFLLICCPIVGFLSQPHAAAISHIKRSSFNIFSCIMRKHRAWNMILCWFFSIPEQSALITIMLGWNCDMVIIVNGCCRESLAIKCYRT